MKRLDCIIVALVAALSLAPLAFFARGGAAQLVRVTQRGEVIYEGALERDATIVADGCTVTVEGGRARVTAADCPDGLCERAGAAAPARPVICLPNELVVTVVTAEEEAFDGVTY